MGLDITAYRQLKPAPEAKLDSDGYPEDWERFTVINQSIIEFVEREWPGRSAGVAAGVFGHTDAFGFRAGSYSGYSWWRDQLARMVYGKSAEAVWADESITSGPFFELIHFADNEGVIGPLVSAKLAADFAEHEPKVAAHAASTDAPEFFAASYANWRRAFTLAADGGAVTFH